MSGALPPDGVPGVEQATRVVLRPIATPVPLGMLALGLGSLLFTGLQLHWYAVGNSPQVAMVILALVVPLELIAALFSFLARDVVMATGYSVLTGSWAAVGALLLSAPPGTTSPVLGTLAIGVAAALLVPAIAAAPAKPVATIVILVAAVRFAATGIYELGAASGWQTASGVIGVVLLGTTLYGSIALALEDARHRQVLPVKRRSTGQQAISGDFAAQLRTLPTEVGVRQES